MERATAIQSWLRDGEYQLSVASPFVDFYSLHAREKYGLPPDWEWFKIEAKGAGATGYHELVGAVSPRLLDGSRDFKNRDKSTEATVVLPYADHLAFLVAWERQTGKCHACYGTGHWFCGWSADHGNKYRKCDRCGGAGAAA